MDSITVTTRDDDRLGPEARVFRIECGHGVSSALLLREGQLVSDDVVVDLMLAGHQRTMGCQCEPSSATCVPGDAYATATAH